MADRVESLAEVEVDTIHSGCPIPGTHHPHHEQLQGSPTTSCTRSAPSKPPVHTSLQAGATSAPILEKEPSSLNKMAWVGVTWAGWTRAEPEGLPTQPSWTRGSPATLTSSPPVILPAGSGQPKHLLGPMDQIARTTASPGPQPPPGTPPPRERDPRESLT